MVFEPGINELACVWVWRDKFSNLFGGKVSAISKAEKWHMWMKAQAEE